MKKIFILVLLFTVIINGIFASGQKGGSYIPPTSPYQNNMGEYLTIDPIELTGTLELINGQPPYLNTGGERFSIMVPFELLYNLNISNGETVTVSGYEMPSGMWQWNNNEKTIRVIQATIKGEVFDIPYYGGHMNMMGGRGNNRNGYYGGMGCW